MKTGRTEKGTFAEGNTGRPKGVENKTTKRAKELVVDLVEAGLPEALEKLKSIKDPKDYLDALAKFISYVVPKQSESSIKVDDVRQIFKIGDTEIEL